MADKKIVKIDDNNVAVIDEKRAIHSKVNLLAEKENLVQRIAVVDELLAVFN